MRTVLTLVDRSENVLLEMCTDEGFTDSHCVCGGCQYYRKQHQQAQPKQVTYSLDVRPARCQGYGEGSRTRSRKISIPNLCPVSSSPAPPPPRPIPPLLLNVPQTEHELPDADGIDEAWNLLLYRSAARRIHCVGPRKDNLIVQYAIEGAPRSPHGTASGLCSAEDD